MSALLEQLAPVPDPADDFEALRRTARARLMQHGFPDLKTEEWKYTPLRLLEQRTLATGQPSGARPPELPFDAVVLFFDHGVLDPERTRLPAGVRLEPLQPADLAEPDYGGREGAFAWLNLARFGQGWKLVIAESPDRPLVLATATSGEFASAVHPRVQVRVEAGVQATLLEIQRDAGAGLVNTVLDIDLADGARLDHAFDRHGADSALIHRTTVAVAAGAEYRYTAVERGERLGRCDVRTYLNGTGAAASIHGVAVLDGRVHVDYHTDVRHQVGGTHSAEDFRVLADGHAVGVFNGRIYMHPGADDSHSDLQTGNLLLSDNARINTKPELEIHAEEVTASHGATVGQLDADAIFYLRSRGLRPDEARQLIKYGFAAAPLERARPEQVRDWLLGELKVALS